MAISPQVTQNGAANVNIMAPKATALAVRINPVGSGQAGEQARKARGPELAEQLNEDTRETYVKGAPLMISFPVCTVSKMVQTRSSVRECTQMSILGTSKQIQVLLLPSKRSRSIPSIKTD